MSELKSRQLSSPTRKNGDPLASLYQIELEENISLEEEALVLMVKLLDNLEELKELKDNLGRARARKRVQGEMMETRLLSLLEVIRADRLI